MLISSSRTRSVASGAVGSPTQAASATSSARRSRDRDGRLDGGASSSRGDGSVCGGDPVHLGRRLALRHAATSSLARRTACRQSIGSGSENAPRDGHHRVAGRYPEQRPHVGDLRTLCTESGRQDGNAGQVLRLDPVVGESHRRTEHHPDRPEPGAVDVSLPHVRDDTGRHAQAVAAHRQLGRRRLRIGRRGQHEDALARIGRARQNPIERSESLIGHRGHGVRLERRPRRQPGLAVGIDGRSDVTAFDVGDHEQPGGARGGQHVLERRVSRRPVSLEERHLRFQDAGPAGHRIHHPEPEVTGTRRGVGQPPEREQLGVRVDPDAEPAGGREDPLEPGSEAFNHGAVTHCAPACPRDRARSPAGCARAPRRGPPRTPPRRRRAARSS